MSSGSSLSKARAALPPAGGPACPRQCCGRTPSAAGSQAAAPAAGGWGGLQGRVLKSNVPYAWRLCYCWEGQDPMARRGSKPPAWQHPPPTAEVWTRCTLHHTKYRLQTPTCLPERHRLEERLYRLRRGGPCSPHKSGVTAAQHAGAVLHSRQCRLSMSSLTCHVPEDALVEVARALLAAQPQRVHLAYRARWT